MKKILIASIAALSLASCAKTKYIATNGDHHYKQLRTYKEVVVYMDKSEVPADVERIGLITCKKGKQNKAFKRAKAMAASKGANAILFTSGRELNGGEKMGNLFLWPGAFKARWKFFALKSKE